MAEETDIAALAQAGLMQAGLALRTRDRREVTITTVDPATGRISGVVPKWWANAIGDGMGALRAPPAAVPGRST